MHIAIPPQAKHQRIVQIVQSVSQKPDYLATQKTQTEQLKKGLMQKLLTGQIRVKSDPQDH